MKREIVCPGCDHDLVKVIPPSYPELTREFEGIRRRRGRARLPMTCDHCNGGIELLGLCFAWSIYRGHMPGAEGRHRSSEYYEWEATRLELFPELPGPPCGHCRSELDPQDAARAQVLVTEDGRQETRALPGSFHHWCCDAAVQAFYQKRLDERAREVGR